MKKVLKIENKKECIERWARRYVKNIQYDRREEYKLLNCKWDAEKKQWFTFNSNKSIWIKLVGLKFL